MRFITNEGWVRDEDLNLTEHTTRGPTYRVISNRRAAFYRFDLTTGETVFAEQPFRPDIFEAKERQLERRNLSMMRKDIADLAKQTHPIEDLHPSAEALVDALEEYFEAVYERMGLKTGRDPKRCYRHADCRKSEQLGIACKREERQHQQVQQAAMARSYEITDLVRETGRHSALRDLQERIYQRLAVQPFDAPMYGSSSEFRQRSGLTDPASIADHIMTDVIVSPLRSLVSRFIQPVRVYESDIDPRDVVAIHITYSDAGGWAMRGHTTDTFHVFETDDHRAFSQRLRTEIAGLLRSGFIYQPG